MVDAAEALPDDDRPPEPSVPSGDRPDWLVSSDQGAEDERRSRDDGAPSEDLRRPLPEGLHLITSNDPSAAPPIERPKIPVRPDPVENRKPEKPATPVAWAAAASSVPKLKVEPTTPGASAPAAAGRVTAPKIELTRAPAMPDRSARSAAAPPIQADPAEDEAAEDEFDAFPDNTGPVAPVVHARSRKLDEPIWVIALDALRSNSRVQLITLAAVLIPLLTWIFLPRSEPGISLHALRSEPARWDGQVVRVNGRVGEVFRVGAGWVFNLHQGRDTIVVFTHGAAPRPRERVSVAGSVSTGYLDGQPRQAIFAEAQSP